MPTGDGDEPLRFPLGGLGAGIPADQSLIVSRGENEHARTHGPTVGLGCDNGNGCPTTARRGHTWGMTEDHADLIIETLSLLLQHDANASLDDPQRLVAALRAG